MSHPFFFTWQAQEGASGPELVGGDGVHFHTADGGRWLDLGSLIYQANLGHGRRDMIDAVRAQAERLCIAMPGAVYPEKTRLAERLLALAPAGFTKVFFTLGGSDANENALKMARLATGRHKSLSRYRSYHGATMGAVSLSGDWRRPAVEPAMVGAVHVDDRDAQDADAVVRALDLEGPKTIAAVFLESVVGGNGVYFPPRGYLSRVREACDRHGTMLVMDEVLAGFGRTGTVFGFEHEPDLVPDMITCGKAITAGYGVLGAVLVHGRVARHFDKNALVAGLTSYAHPLAIASALAALDAYEREALPARAASLEPVLREALEGLARANPAVVKRTRVIGLLSATDLVLNADGWARLAGALRARRVHAHVQAKVGALVLAPPLIISKDDLLGGVRLVGEAIREATS